MLCKLIQQQGDIDTFSRDPLEYHYFMEVFIEAVDKRIEGLRGMPTRLIKYTTGEAKVKYQALHQILSIASNNP